MSSPFLSDYDLHLLAQGSHFRSYEKLGAHLAEKDGQVRRLLRGLGPQRRARLGHRGLQRLALAREPDDDAQRLGDLGDVHSRPRPGDPLQVRDRIPLRRLQGAEGRPLRLLLRASPQDRLEGLGSLRVRMGGRGVDGAARRGQLPARADLDLRGAPRLVDAGPRGGKPLAQLPRARDAARRLRAGAGIHPRGVPADLRASLRRLLGIPDGRLLRRDEPVRDPPGLHEPDRRAAPARHRRDPGLGSRALPPGPARARLLRRDPPVRALRLEAARPQGLGHLDLQLRAMGGQQLPDLLGPVLARQVPHRRPARGRGRLHALPGLRPGRGRVEAEPVRRPREPRRDPLPAAVQRAGLRRPPGRDHLRRGVHRVADGVAADLRWGASASG